MAIALKRAERSISISRRLTGWLLVGIGLLLLITGIGLAIIIGQRLQNEYDRALLIRAQALIALTDQDREGVELEFTDAAMPEFDTDHPTPAYFQLRLADDDQELARSPSLEGTDLLRPSSRARSEGPHFYDLILPDGRAGRAVRIDFLPRLDLDDDDEIQQAANAPALAALPRRPLALTVARERERLNELLTTVQLTLAMAGLVVMVLVVLLVRFSVANGLRPLAEIRDQIARFNADSLNNRLRPVQRTEELDGMVAQFNALLERLQAAFERERQFSADVAHELRTPLAELRNLAEVGGRWPEDKKLARAFFRDVLDATGQMERIVVNLLALARCERGLDSVATAAFDLPALINTAWGRARTIPEATDKRLRFRYQGPGRLPLTRGQDQWTLIFNNLLSNAVAYSPPGGEIVATIDADAVTNNALKVRLSNRAKHLSQEDLPRLFDRLWRKDAARSSGHHAGLGLTLVSAYARQLELQITPRLDGQLFSFELSGVLRAEARSVTGGVQTNKLQR